MHDHELYQEVRSLAHTPAGAHELRTMAIARLGEAINPEEFAALAKAHLRAHAHDTLARALEPQDLVALTRAYLTQHQIQTTVQEMLCIQMDTYIVCQGEGPLAMNDPSFEERARARCIGYLDKYHEHWREEIPSGEDASSEELMEHLDTGSEFMMFHDMYTFDLLGTLESVLVHGDVRQKAHKEDGRDATCPHP